jgi:hypothetical protein
MALLGIEQGIQAYLLPYALNNATPANLKVHLYTNNHAPAAGDTIANYTECTDTGYSAQSLAGGSWTFADVSNVTTASYPAITWTFNAAQTIYGYYVTDTGTNKVIWAEEFSAALNFGAGQQLSLTLNITLS